MELVEGAVAPELARWSAGAPADRAPGPLATDPILARRAAAGDVDAFTELVDRHGPAVLRWARVLLPAPDADACVVNTFRALWRGTPSYRADVALRPWLFSIARRLAVPRGAHQPVEPGSTLNPAPPLLTAALAELSPPQRLVWTLHAVERFECPDIAFVVGSTQAFVQELLAQSQGTLARELSDHP